MLLDIVPNHMATGDENPFWADEALRERYFDIDPRTGRHRRFFSIDELAGVRVEDPEVFETTHARSSAGRRGVVDGLRIDHPDGLADPAGTCGAWPSAASAVWVEKILEPGEELPDWPVEGTTGYEFMADATGLFIDPAGEEPRSTPAVGERRAFAELAAEAKRGEAHTTFQPEVERLRELADDAARHGRRSPPCPCTAPTSIPSEGADRRRTTRVVEGRLPERGCDALRPTSTPTRRPSRCASSRRPAR